ncbi:MAG: DUF3592 domain-containing protein [Burkholderiales bacterium]
MRGIQIFMLCVGGLAALVGILVAILRVRTLASGRRTMGTVVGIASSSTNDMHSRVKAVHAPEVEFRHEGRKVRFRSSLSTPKTFAVGASVPVRYLPSDPETSAEIDSVARMWGFPAGALVFAALFLGLALYDGGSLIR